MSDRVTTEAMLARAVAELEAAEAFGRLVAWLVDLHQPLGGFIGDALRAVDVARLTALSRAPREDFAFELMRRALRVAPSKRSTWTLLSGVAAHAPDADLVAVAVPLDVALHGTADGAPMRVQLTSDEITGLVQDLLAIAVPTPDRRLVLGRYGRRAWLQIRGSRAEEGWFEALRSREGRAEAAGGVMVLAGTPPVLAECWLPMS